MTAMFEMVFFLTNKESRKREKASFNCIFYILKNIDNIKKTQFSVFYFPLFILLISHNKSKFQNCDQKHP